MKKIIGLILVVCIVFNTNVFAQKELIENGDTFSYIADFNEMHLLVWTSDAKYCYYFNRPYLMLSNIDTDKITMFEYNQYETNYNSLHIYNQQQSLDSTSDFQYSLLFQKTINSDINFGFTLKNK